MGAGPVPREWRKEMEIPPEQRSLGKRTVTQTYSPVAEGPKQCFLGAGRGGWERPQLSTSSLFSQQAESDPQLHV